MKKYMCLLVLHFIYNWFYKNVVASILLTNKLSLKLFPSMKTLSVSLLYYLYSLSEVFCAATTPSVALKKPLPPRPEEDSASSFLFYDINWDRLVQRLQAQCLSDNLCRSKINSISTRAMNLHVFERAWVRSPLFVLGIQRIPGNSEQPAVFGEAEFIATDKDKEILSLALENLLLEYAMQELLPALFAVYEVQRLCGVLNIPLNCSGFSNSLVSVFTKEGPNFQKHLKDDGFVPTKSRMNVVINFQLFRKYISLPVLAYLKKYLTVTRNVLLYSEGNDPAILANPAHSVTQIITAIDNLQPSTFKLLQHNPKLYLISLYFIGQTAPNALSTVLNCLLESKLGSADLVLRAGATADNTTTTVYSFEPTTLSIDVVSFLIIPLFQEQLNILKEKYKAADIPASKRNYLTEILKAIYKLMDLCSEWPFEKRLPLFINQLCSNGRLNTLSKKDRMIVYNSALIMDTYALFIKELLNLSKDIPDIEETISDELPAPLITKKGNVHIVFSSKEVDIMKDNAWHVLKTYVKEACECANKNKPLEDDAENILVELTNIPPNESLETQLKITIQNIVRVQALPRKENTMRLQVVNNKIVLREATARELDKKKRTDMAVQAARQKKAIIDEIIQNKLNKRQAPSEVKETEETLKLSEEEPSSGLSNVSTPSKFKHVIPRDKVQLLFERFHCATQTLKTCWIHYSVGYWASYRKDSQMPLKAYKCHDFIDVLALWQSAEQMARYFIVCAYGTPLRQHMSLYARSSLYIYAAGRWQRETGFLAIGGAFIESWEDASQEIYSLSHLRIESARGDSQAPTSNNNRGLLSPEPSLSISNTHLNPIYSKYRNYYPGMPSEPYRLLYSDPSTNDIFIIYCARQTIDHTDGSTGTDTLECLKRLKVSRILRLESLTNSNRKLAKQWGNASFETFLQKHHIISDT